MSDRRTFEKDVERDARLVAAAYVQAKQVPDARGMVAAIPFELQAMGMGLSPDEALVHHPAWLKKQGKTYIDQVAARAEQLLEAQG